MLENKKPVELKGNYEIEIIDFSHKGEGVGRFQDFTIFVEGAILGEKVLVEVYEIKKNFARAYLKEIRESSKKRREAPCKIVSKCGGCQLQHLAYEEQLEMKRKRVEDDLKKIGQLDLEVRETLGMEEAFFYRNNGQFHISEKKGKIELGFYQQKSKELIASPACLLFSQEVNSILADIENYLNKDKKRYKSYLRTLVIRESKATKEIMLVFITQKKQWLLEELLEDLSKKYPQIKSVYQNIKAKPSRFLYSKEMILRRGKESIEEHIGSLKFQISPQSFFQVNSLQTESLYQKVLESLDLKGNETVIDAYSGIGSISLFLAKKAKKVYGVEIIKPAVENARENAKENKISNVEFINAKAENWLLNYAKEKQKVDAVVLDPPRKGCHNDTLEALKIAQPEKIVYVSCNPASLARDLKELKNHYTVKEVQAVDMFPQTAHVECVTLMSRIKE